MMVRNSFGGYTVYNGRTAIAKNFNFKPAVFYARRRKVQAATVPAANVTTIYAKPSCESRFQFVKSNDIVEPEVDTEKVKEVIDLKVKKPAGLSYYLGLIFKS